VLPDSIDGAKVRVDIPDSVLTTIGPCTEQPIDERPEPEDLPKSAPGDCTIFMQMPSPKVSAPPDMPLKELGKIYLQVLGMDEADAEVYANTVDWTTTFVLPIPRGRTEYKEVQVDGVPATLVLMHNGGKSFTLLWVKEGIVYVLTGSGGEGEAMRLASTIQ
jgi:hypothetical protein